MTPPSLKLRELGPKAVPQNEFDGQADRASVVPLQPEYKSGSTEDEKSSTLHTAARAAPEPKPGILTRLFSLMVLIGIGTIVALAAMAAYHAFADSFVAPLILSPDSDLVIQNKLSLNRMLSERERLLARIEEDTAAIKTAESALAILTDLQDAAQRTSQKVTSTGPVKGGRRPGTKLAAGQNELLAVLQRQAKHVGDLEQDLKAGLVSSADLMREQNALNQIRVALVRDERENISAQAQLARLQLDILKNQGEQLARMAQRRANQEELARLEVLVAQLNQRPLFRAIDTSQTLGFAPYSQLRGIRSGDSVYQCNLWGFFGCTLVGKVGALIPGEVVSQDPWGSSTRGEYIVLELTDKAAAQARSLRVRAEDERPSFDDESTTAAGPSSDQSAGTNLR